MSIQLTEAAFERALASKGITAAQEDRNAAFAIACYLDNCARILRDSAENKTDDAK